MTSKYVVPGARNGGKVRIAVPQPASMTDSSNETVDDGKPGGGVSLLQGSPIIATLRSTKSEALGPTQKFEVQPAVKLNPASQEWKPATAQSDVQQNGVAQDGPAPTHNDKMDMINNNIASAQGRKGDHQQVQPHQPAPPQPIYTPQMAHPMNGSNGVNGMPIQYQNGVQHPATQNQNGVSQGLQMNGVPSMQLPAPMQNGFNGVNGQYGGSPMSDSIPSLRAQLVQEQQYQPQYQTRGQTNIVPASQPAQAIDQMPQQQQAYQPAPAQGMIHQQLQQLTPTHRASGNVNSFNPNSITSMTSPTCGTPSLSLMMSSPNYLRTEPRNFAPRTAGSAVTNEPPPRFALTPMPLGQFQQSNGVMSPPDPFSTPLDPFQAGQLSSVVTPIDMSSQQQNSALVPYSNPVPENIRALRSRKLNDITAGPTGRPTQDVALHPNNFPFVETALNAQGVQHGVVKIKNIPFSTKRAEILAFLGRNSKVLNDNQEPVHIIMERVSSKTNDAYVEFMTMQAAANAVEKHNKTISNNRVSRLGDRPVDVELSSQAALMKDLFPLAKGVRWDGPYPVVLQDHPTEPWNCFKGFVTDEEMTMLVKHVEVPQRSPFSRDCPQRPYESMISTLRKMPWYQTNFITIRQRHAVYKACLELIRLLQAALREKKDPECLTTQVFKRLWTSAMLCDGFTVAMKDNIAYQIDLPEHELRNFNQPRHASMWLHQYTLSPKAGVPIDVLEWYIAIIREESTKLVHHQPVNVTAQILQDGASTDLYWGYFFREVNTPQGTAFDHLSLAEMASLEFGALDRIIRRAFAPGQGQ